MFLWGAALVALAPLVVDCGGGGDDDDDNGGTTSGPCSTVLQGKCGGTCDDARPCGAGLFCSNGTCTAQCTMAEGGCTGGQVCTTNGRCIANGGGSGGASGAGPIGPGLSGAGGTGGSAGVSGAGGGGDCPDVKIAFQPINPAVMVVVDRSASMKCHIDREAELYPQGDCPQSDSENDATSRWRSLKEPLLQVMQELQGDVIFGATFYTTANQCALDVDGVPFRIENFDEIKATYDGLIPQGSTPTAGAIAAATATTNASDNGLPGDTPKFIILASDGSPNCAGNQDAQVATVNAVAAAYDSGIKTFVVAIGQLFSAVPEKEERFQEIADAGAGFGKPGGATEKPKLYLASDREVLANDLRSIINGVRPCSFDLDVALTNPEADAPKGVVTIDDQPVPFDATNGWRLADNDTVEFVGTACTSIQNGSTNVQASFPCGVQTTPVPPRPPPPR